MKTSEQVNAELARREAENNDLAAKSATHYALPAMDQAMSTFNLADTVRRSRANAVTINALTWVLSNT